MDAAKTRTRKTHDKGDRAAKKPAMQKAKRPDALTLSPVATGLLDALEAWRARLGLSRERFAVLILGVSCSTYERWQRGRFNPSLQTALRLQALLADSDLVPARLTAETDPELAELWDNPQDAVYDNL